MPDFKKKTQAGETADTSWDKVAFWYDNLLESGQGTYQRDLILPNVLRLLEIKKGEKVLDLACGQGFFSRELYKVGASVIGVDLSRKLIVLAEKQSPKEIRFAAAAADRLGFLPNASMDVVVCLLAIQNMKNAGGVFEEAARVLARGGRFLIVMNHPTFRIPKRSSWGFDENSKVQYRRVDEYLSESSAAIAARPGLNTSRKRVGQGSDKALATVSFHHPLQFYFKALHKAGFVVSRLEEWNSVKQSEPGPRASAENKARKEFPLFLALEAKKV